MADAGLFAFTRAIIGGVTAVATGPAGVTDLPDIDIATQLAGNGPGIVTEIRNQPQAGTVFLSNRRNTPLEALPDTFLQAVLATEDARFGSHPGVDPVAVVSAAIDTLRGDLRGGSTVTQQLVKNAVTGPSRTLERKLIEAAIALRATQASSSERILEGYFSHAWFGRGEVGAAGAARAWFDKPWSEITLPEAAFLAALLKGPAHYDPLRFPERALERRNYVLDRMHEEGLITQEEMESAKATPLEVAPQSDPAQNRDPWMVSAISAELGGLPISVLPSQGRDALWADTTFSSRWQEIATSALIEHVSGLGGSGPMGQIALPDRADPQFHDHLRARARPFALTSRTFGRAIDVSADGDRAFLLDRGFGDLVPFRPDVGDVNAEKSRPGDVWAYTRVDGRPVLSAQPNLDAAVVVMDARTGAILASVGGVKPAGLSAFDRTRAPRQPGSSIKPFLWLQALDLGYLPDTLIQDYERDYITAEGTTWRPRNYDGSQSGYLPLYAALEESSNNAAASLINAIGVEELGWITEAAGVYPEGMLRHPTAALGAVEATLTHMAAGYAAILNGGYRVSPHAISRLGSGSEILWQPTVRGTQIATPEHAHSVAAMMRGVILRGTAAGAFPDHLEIAGKTGTSSDYRDAWFIGGTPELVLAVWVGRDDNSPLPGRSTGSRAAAPVVRAILEAAIADGLLDESGRGPDPDTARDWPPTLLQHGYTPMGTFSSYPSAPSGSSSSSGWPSDIESQADNSRTTPSDYFVERDLNGTLIPRRSIFGD